MNKLAFIVFLLISANQIAHADQNTLEYIGDAEVWNLRVHQGAKAKFFADGREIFTIVGCYSIDEIENTFRSLDSGEIAISSGSTFYAKKKIDPNHKGIRIIKINCENSG